MRANKARASATTGVIDSLRESNTASDKVRRCSCKSFKVRCRGSHNSVQDFTGAVCGPGGRFRTLQKPVPGAPGAGSRDQNAAPGAADPGRGKRSTPGALQGQSQERRRGRGIRSDQVRSDQIRSDQAEMSVQESGLWVG